MGTLTCLVALLAIAVCLLGQDAEAACGYKSCPATKSTMLNIHLVPHSHDDVGWLKTVDQYYYGSRTSIQRAGVQYILDSVIVELAKDPKRRFIYVESAFFFRWYNEQSATTKREVQTLVKAGRLEFIGGAWSMNDEAAVHYQSVIDQFTIGLKLLADTFGTCGRPHVGWQIDPFGHSREMASIFAQMGYDGQFITRTDWVEKNTRMQNKTAEMIWKASENLGERSELFTGILYNEYADPPGFCFDTLCQDDPIIDGSSYDNNVNERVDAFLTYVNALATRYRANHLMVPMGEDFHYQNAEMNFKNMDKLIKYVNERQAQGSKVNVLYSTPSCYLNALHESQLTWPNKTQDFFPYSVDMHTYWTGYFTSRPTQKRFERDGNHFLQVTNQLSVLANLTTNEQQQNLDKLRQVMGIMQHHDAITGTEKQHVASDYDRLLADGLAAAQNNARMALQKLTNLTSGEFVSCLQLNISVCDFTRVSANNVVVTLYNPLAHPSTQYVRVPVKNEIFVVTDENGLTIRSQVVPVPKEVIALPFRPTDTQYELVFQASVDKIANYYIKSLSRAAEENVCPSSPARCRLQKHLHDTEEVDIEPNADTIDEIESRADNFNEIEPRADTIIQNSAVKLTFDTSGHLKTVEMNGITENIRQDFYYYKGALGNNREFKNRSSGAYIFRPNGTEVLLGNTVSLTVHDGPLVKEVHQRFGDWVSQVVRIYEGQNRVEFEWLVGPIPVKDEIGKEIVTRFQSSVDNRGVFWTDSNGREMMRRVRNEREYFKPNTTEAVASNYYPITARLALQDNQKRIALLNDRAQGGSSVRDGSLELMVHRRLLHDDAFGVGEALNETAYGEGVVARGKVYLVLSPVSQRPTIYERNAQQELHLPFWKFFSSANKASNVKPVSIPSFASLPVTVHVLTLSSFSANERLLRLENFMDNNETSAVSFNIRSIFDSLGGEEINETTLDGSMPLKDMKRFKFQPDGSTNRKVEYYTTKHTPLKAAKKDAVSKFDVTLEPMQIRTFVIKWK